MTLGEKIYELRTKQGLSQGDLAEQLNVSRQSISKWETGSSTPDLDKLIKMSQLFQVTLDELVLDKKPGAEKTAGSTDSISESTQDKTESPFSHERQHLHETHFSTRKIAGTILICMGFMTFLLFTALSDPITGVVLAAPFLLCGGTCFIFRKHIGLWCAWVLFCSIDLYLRWGSIISWQAAISFIRWGIYSDNPIAVILCMMMLLFLIILIVVTILLFSKKSLQTSGCRLIIYFTGWTVYLLLSFSNRIAPRIYALIKYTFCYTLYSWIKIALFTLLITFTVRFLRFIRTKYLK